MKGLSDATWLPRWAKRLIWFVGLPCWLGFAALIVTGALFQHKMLLLLLFGGFFAAAAVAAFYQWRATWRGEI